ncbi:hypothetical protein NIES4071_82730 [Calothrix sp. NIES-4071]|nr:hypothetical protein NIES4071_82730 [Calothrix sp. NIES-4071]BAZ62542.1 hypothetical protein NIES4105_82660 [Calothrix sp. NIES-4105]
MTTQNWKKLFVVFGLGITAVTPFLPASAKEAPKAERFRVVGTEPFWGIDINQKGIVYTSVKDNINKQTFRYVPPQPAQGRTLEAVRVYRFGANPNHILILHKDNGYCSDGMSDNKYPYTATLISGNTVKTGCAQNQ